MVIENPQPNMNEVNLIANDLLNGAFENPRNINYFYKKRADACYKDLELYRAILEELFSRLEQKKISLERFISDAFTRNYMNSHIIPNGISVKSDVRICLRK